jgi:mycofactocin precursor peptide peptidase
MDGVLAEATWPDAEGARLVLVPVSSLEQHGPHLPLDTDTAIAEAVTQGVAARLHGAWVAPALSYGASGEHQSFPGTTSIGSDVLHLVVVELVRSLRTWATRVVLVNAHGGNVPLSPAQSSSSWWRGTTWPGWRVPPRSTTCTRASPRLL